MSFDKGDFFTKIISLKIFPSRDSSKNPLDHNAIFSWQKRATAGSSFYDVEKKSFDQEIATDGGK
ncbi:hypothetical protein [Flavobacterium xanthum]|uniref:hypothetical protein n=1 Tax=Flavobacterium xanthum TaxID=69322 RepID=UPI0011147BE4|nr:hypothetical protein [Flavobacterium xanthum]